LKCPICGSRSIARHGDYKTKKGRVPRFRCKSCGKTFSKSSRLIAKYNPMLVEIVVDLYERGVSLREICSHLKKIYGIKISHRGVHKWVLKRGCKKIVKPRLRKATRYLIKIAEDLYKKGLSLRDIAHHFETIYKIELSRTIIHRWVRKIPKGHKPRVKRAIKEWRKLSSLYSHGKPTATRVIMLPATLLREAGIDPAKNLVGRWDVIEKGKLLFEIKEKR